jgi:hypothetical protein
MGNFNLKKYYSIFLGGGSILVFFHSLPFAQNKKPTSSLADAFQNTPVRIADVEEVEPIVVGRKKWSDPAPNTSSVFQSHSDPKKTVDQSGKIEELDPLETEQGKVDPALMPIEPPSIPPAVNLHRNFEGTLVLKSRKFGFQSDFPFQLVNSRGKRLAYIDTQGLRAVDPLSLKDRKVNILGKLEPIKEGSDELVIRARLLREIE